MYTMVDSSIYTYVKSSTGNYAVANTVVVYGSTTICIQYIIPMYTVCICIYTKCTSICNICESVVLTTISRGYIGGISLFVQKW
jgi:hypothetical protein